MKCSYDQRPNCNTMSVLFAHVSQLTHLHFCMVYVLICPTTWAELPSTFLWVRKRKGSAWITSSLQSHLSPNFWTNQLFSLLSNWFCQVVHLLIYKPMVKTEPTVSGTWLLGLGSKLLIIPTCSRCSTKTLLNSCRVFLEYHMSKSSKQRKDSSGRVYFSFAA